MNAKERVLAVLDRRPVDRFPVDIWYTPEVYASLSGHFGTDNEPDLWRAMGVDKIAWVNAPYDMPAEIADRSLWGAEMKTIDTGQAMYGELASNPLAHCQTPEDVAAYPWWPDPDRFDYDAAAAQAAALVGEFATLGPWVSFFEIYCQMRGLEQSMMDVLVDPDLVDAILDRIEACQTAMMRRFFERAAGNIHLAFLSDDMGSQSGLLFSEDTWDRFLKDRMKRWCDLMHGYGVKVFYHSDGAVAPLLPRLVEAGIDVLNPIQHVCAGMDTAGLKDCFGDRLVFHGAIDTQRVLPFGTPDDVRAEVGHCISTLGRDGEGFICCSCHNIQPGTPVDNVIAMVEAVKNTPAR
jgi:uroporphyrinogen decarboxylase